MNVETQAVIMACMGVVLTVWIGALFLIQDLNYDLNRDRIKSVEKRVDHLYQDHSDLNLKVIGVEGRVESTEWKVEQVEGDADRARQEIRKVRGEVTDVKTDVSELRGRMRARSSAALR